MFLPMTSNLLSTNHRNLHAFQKFDQKGLKNHLPPTLQTSKTLRVPHVSLKVEMLFFEPDITKHCYLMLFTQLSLIFSYPPAISTWKHWKILCLSTSPLKNLAQTASSSQLQKQTMLTSAFFPFPHSILRTVPRRVKMSLTPATPLCIIAFALHRHFSHWL